MPFQTNVPANKNVLVNQRRKFQFFYAKMKTFTKKYIGNYPNSNPFMIEKTNCNEESKIIIKTAENELYFNNRKSSFLNPTSPTSYVRTHSSLSVELNFLSFFAFLPNLNPNIHTYPPTHIHAFARSLTTPCVYELCIVK